MIDTGMQSKQIELEILWSFCWFFYLPYAALLTAVWIVRLPSVSLTEEHALCILFLLHCQ